MMTRSTSLFHNFLDNHDPNSDYPLSLDDDDDNNSYNMHSREEDEESCTFEIPVWCYRYSYTKIVDRRTSRPNRSWV